MEPKIQRYIIEGIHILAIIRIYLCMVMKVSIIAIGLPWSILLLLFIQNILQLHPLILLQEYNMISWFSVDSCQFGRAAMNE